MYKRVCPSSKFLNSIRYLSPLFTTKQSYAKSNCLALDQANIIAKTGLLLLFLIGTVTAQISVPCLNPGDPCDIFDNAVGDCSTTDQNCVCGAYNLYAVAV